MTWQAEFSGRSTATGAELFAVLAEPSTWWEWNEGVLRIEMAAPFAEGARRR